jgi:hypothetical protein
MEQTTMLTIPQDALRRLEFLSGEYEGRQTLYLTEGAPVTYDAFCTVSREACERFIKAEFVAAVPNIGVESWTAFATYSTRKNCYDPWSMPWGLQRLRGTFTPYANGSFEYMTEMWEPDGYTKFRHTVFHRRAPRD